MPDIIVTLKLTDELTKGMEKATASTKEFEKTLEVTEESAKTLIKQFADLGVNTDEMSNEFLALNPEVKKSIALLDKLGVTSGKSAKGIKEFERKEKEAEKQSKKLKTQLKGLVKGFLGISGALVAGRALANFAKDALAAADAAGKLPPIFDEAEKTSQRLKEAAGEQLAGGLEKSKHAFVALAEPTIKNLELSNRLTDARRKGLITEIEFNRMRTAQKGGQEASLRISRALLILEQQHNQVALTGNEILAQRVAEVERLEALRFASVAEAGITVTTADEIAERVQAELEALRQKQTLLESITSLEARAGRAGDIPATRPLDANLRALGPAGVTPISGDAFGVQSDLSAQVGGAIDQLQLYEQGQLEVQDTYDLIVMAYKDGLLSIEATEREMTKVAVQSTRNSLAAGDFNTEQQAAIALAGDLGITMGEALEMIRNMDTAAEGLPTGIADAGEAVDELQLSLDKLTRTPYRVNIAVNILGLPGGITLPALPSGGFGTGTTSTVGFASGGSLTVPPGFPNDSFGIGVSSGEEVNVRTATQQRNGGDMSVLEGKFDRLSSDMRNMVLEMTQAIAERG